MREYINNFLLSGLSSVFKALNQIVFLFVIAYFLTPEKVASYILFATLFVFFRSIITLGINGYNIKAFSVPSISDEKFLLIVNLLFLLLGFVVTTFIVLVLYLFFDKYFLIGEFYFYYLFLTLFQGTYLIFESYYRAKLQFKKILVCDLVIFLIPFILKTIYLFWGGEELLVVIGLDFFISVCLVLYLLISESIIAKYRERISYVLKFINTFKDFTSSIYRIPMFLFLGNLLFFVQNKLNIFIIKGSFETVQLVASFMLCLTVLELLVFSFVILNNVLLPYSCRIVEKIKESAGRLKLLFKTNFFLFGIGIVISLFLFCFSIYFENSKYIEYLSKYVGFMDFFKPFLIIIPFKLMNQFNYNVVIVSLGKTKITFKINLISSLILFIGFVIVFVLDKSIMNIVYLTILNEILLSIILLNSIKKEITHEK